MDVKAVAGSCLLLTALWWPCGGGGCPPDTPTRAQQCFANLTWGVAPAVDDDNGLSDIDGHGHAIPSEGTFHDRPGLRQDGSGLGSGSRSGRVPGSATAIPLDYRMIREYCAQDGHMLRFVHCVEELSQHCPDVPPDGAFAQLINPQRVRTSVPRLCNHEDVIEENSECMNSVLKEGSACKERAYTSVRSLSGPPRSASSNNTTSTFFLQCRYFSVLAECQRTEMSQACGSSLGDLHADFLLSFVPNLCSPHPSPGGLPEDHRDHRLGNNGGLRTGTGLTEVPKKKDLLHHGSSPPVNARGKAEGKGRVVGDGSESGGTVESEQGLQSKGTTSERIPHLQSGADGTPEGTELSSPDENVYQHTATKQAPSPQPSSVSAKNPAPSSTVHGPVRDAATQEVTSAQEVTTTDVSTNTHVTRSSPSPAQTSVGAVTVFHQEMFSVAFSLVVSFVLFLSF